MGRLFLINEVRTSTDVRGALADPSRHWRAGYSAYELAHAWTADPHALPASVRAVFDQQPELADAELVEAFFERKVELGTPGRPSQNDVLAYCATPRTSFAVAVEGKVRERFGPYVRDRAPDLFRDARVLSLCRQLGLAPADAPPLRYQLLHRAVSALREARRYHAPHAVLLVHSFDPGQSSLTDYQAFAGALGLPAHEAVPGRVCGPIQIDGIHLHLAWVTDHPQASLPRSSADHGGADTGRSRTETLEGAAGATSAGVLDSSTAHLAMHDAGAVPGTATEPDALAGFDATVCGLVMRIRHLPAPDEAKPARNLSSAVSRAFKKLTRGRDYKAHYDPPLRRAIAELGEVGGAPVGLLAQLAVALKDEDSDRRWKAIHACRRGP